MEHMLRSLLHAIILHAEKVRHIMPKLKLHKGSFTSILWLAQAHTGSKEEKGYKSKCVRVPALFSFLHHVSCVGELGEERWS